MIYDQFGRPAPPARPRQIGFVAPPPAPLGATDGAVPEVDAVASISIGPIDEVDEL